MSFIYIIRNVNYDILTGYILRLYTIQGLHRGHIYSHGSHRGTESLIPLPCISPASRGPPGKQVLANPQTPRIPPILTLHPLSPDMHLGKKKHF